MTPAGPAVRAKSWTGTINFSFIKTFKSYDKNGDGVMDQSEFKNIMIDLGFRKITDEKVNELLNE